MFKPHDAQLKALTVLKDLKNKFVCIYGGSRAGKTRLICEYIKVRAYTYPGSRHLIVRSAFSHAKMSIWGETLKDVFKGVPTSTYELSQTDLVIKLANGSEIYVGGLDDSTRTEKVLGREFCTIYLNETSQINYEVTTLAMTRLAQVIKGCQNKFICDLNPHSKNSWVYKYFILKICPITGEPLPNHEEIAYAQINPKDNIAHLGEEYIRTLSNLPEHQRVRFLNGEFADTAGSIFKHIETVDSFPEYLDYSIGIDFGFTTDPATIVKVGVESEYIYIEELLYEHGLTNSDLIQRMNTIGIGAFDIIFADSAEPKSVEELRRAGYSNISGCTKGADSIRNGIDWMLSHKLRIVRGSNHTISEFQNLQWAKTSSGDNIAKPMPGNDHTVDGVRYALNNHITGSSAEACISFSM